MSAWHNHKVFAQSALRHLQDLQEKINKTSSQASSIYLFYILLGSWPDLLRNLRLKYKKLHVKIVSHLGPAHEHFVNLKAWEKTCPLLNQKSKTTNAATVVPRQKQKKESARRLFFLVVLSRRIRFLSLSIFQSKG